ncbi:MAG: DUF58 domain-containing protein [Burkholderiales bacterium]|nr:MAG: DUF58 domain-containing protein [Burkholderiales bacterium]
MRSGSPALPDTGPDAVPKAARTTGTGARLRQRLRRWIQSRQPRTDTLLQTHRNVYILPTRPGLMLALTLLLLLVASINYQLNLGYLLTFLLAGSAVVGMHRCHGNLRGLSLHLNPPAPVHAGRAVSLEVRLSNPGRQERHAIALLVDEPVRAAPAWTDVPAQGDAVLHLAWPAPKRGRLDLPTLRAQTLFPLGVFRVWSLWQPAADVLVYPAPETHPPPLPAGEAVPGHGGHAQAHSSGELDGVRAYRRGDPMRTVVWRKAAKAFAAGRDDLVSRDLSVSQRQQLWLDHARCGAPDLESRLSRLCAWVLLCDRLGLAYGLRLPGVNIPPDQGPAHRTRCLEAMALC